MKKYKDLSVIGHNDSKNFLETLSKNIEEYQNKGYEVEVQYSAVEHILTALILAYTNEE